MARAVVCVVFALVLAAPVRANAEAVLLLAEPFGRAGSIYPTGHMSVYLPRVCADSPSRLRRCTRGETGVVIGRYHKVHGADWFAIPLIPYLYAVERAEDIPASVDPATVLALRDAYRRAHLRSVIPDGPSGDVPKGDWYQLLGAAYDRRFVGFGVRTTTEQDDRLIEALNASPNTPRFNLLFRNCADFASDILNFYFPKSVRSNWVSDLGFTTPKQVARSLVKHALRRPELELSVFVVPQVPGSRPTSRKARGILESLLKSKKYAIPLGVVQPWMPWVPTGIAAGYLVTGRFDANQYVMTTYTPEALEAQARQLSTE